MGLKTKKWDQKWLLSTVPLHLPFSSPVKYVFFQCLWIIAVFINDKHECIWLATFVVCRMCTGRLKAWFPVEQGNKSTHSYANFQNLWRSCTTSPSSVFQSFVLLGCVEGFQLVRWVLETFLAFSVSWRNTFKKKKKKKVFQSFDWGEISYKCLYKLVKLHINVGS